MTELLRIDEENHLIELMKDEVGHFFNPANDFNNIEYWNLFQGYQIKVTEAVNVEWSGILMHPQSSIPLHEGWNYVAYLPTYELSAAAPDFFVLGDIIDNVSIAKDIWGHFINTEYGFSNMEPWRMSQGYQLHVDENVVLHYPEEPDDQVNFATIEPLELTPPTPYNMSVLVLVQGTGLAGSTVEAVNSTGKVIGIGSIDSQNRGGLSVWGDDPTTQSREGLLEGESFTLRINENERTTQPVNQVLDGEGLVYKTDSWTVIDAFQAVTGAEMPTEFSLLSAYPNPFNNRTRISYTLPDVARIEVSVFDIQGRPVKTLFNGMQQAGHQSLVWNADGVSSGIYIVRLSDGQTSLNQKVLLAR